MMYTYALPLDLSALQPLRGSVFVPGDDGYEQASLTWETFTFTQRPALVILPLDSTDVLVAVAFAREHNLPIAVQGGGHGHPFAMDALEREHALLLNFAHMKAVQINPQQATARVEPGAKWSDVIPLAHEYGLAPLNGFASDVGVSSYLLGGGFGWLVRQYGLGASSICSLEVITAAGQCVHVDAHTHPDLFWGLRGGSGNFGIVTAIAFALYPVGEVFGGQVLYPVEQNKQVVTAYLQWVKTVPETLTSTFRIMHFPPIPTIPPALQGRAAVIVVGCYNGTETEGMALFEPMRTLDPIDAPPLSFYNSHVTLRNFDADQIDALVAIAANPASGLFQVEMRHLGGVLARIPEDEMAASLRDVEFSLYAMAAAPAPELLMAGTQSVNQIMQAIPSDTHVPVLLNALAFNDIGLERTRAAFTPANYQRLVALKNSYDPTNMFRFNNNIPPSS